MDRAFHQDEELPPVELYKIGEWQAELDTLRVREKAHTREGDAIADRPTWSSNNDMLCSVSELISASTLRECGHVIH